MSSAKDVLAKRQICEIIADLMFSVKKMDPYNYKLAIRRRGEVVSRAE